MSATILIRYNEDNPTGLAYTASSHWVIQMLINLAEHHKKIYIHFLHR